MITKRGEENGNSNSTTVHGLERVCGFSEQRGGEESDSQIWKEIDKPKQNDGGDGVWYHGVFFWCLGQFVQGGKQAGRHTAPIFVLEPQIL